ncbi:MAG: site-specific integrase, partial [Terracidiphilus sp.]
FELAGLPYFHPHSLRKTLARLGEQVCRSPEDFKAWSQNLGHEKVLTTFLNYGSVTCDRQGEILRGLITPRQRSKSDAGAIAEELFNRLRDSGVNIQAQ